MKARCKWVIGVAMLVHGVAWSTEQAREHRDDAAVAVEWLRERDEATTAGTLIDRFSVLEAFERSEFRSLLTNMPREGDLLHTEAPRH